MTRLEIAHNSSNNTPEISLEQITHYNAVRAHNPLGRQQPYHIMALNIEKVSTEVNPKSCTQKSVLNVNLTDLKTQLSTFILSYFDNKIGHNAAK